AELKVTGTTARKAIDLVNEAKQNGLTAGKDPTGLAAAAIYIAGILEGERRTQREIAETATVTEVTVRNRYKELVRKLEISITI
ncbi:MAG: transcription initiation factor IIB, partial [Candidatus Kariarchaeaceae archaeon]